MVSVLPFEKVTQREKTGDKAFILAEMFRERFPVSPGFVLTIDAFFEFLQKNKLEKRIDDVIKSVDTENYESLTRAYDEIKALFTSSMFPDELRKEIVEGYEGLVLGNEARKVGGAALEFIRAGRDRATVVVRLSAVSETKLSFSGIYESFFGISGVKELLDAIKRCWASFYSPKSMIYLKAHRLEKVYPCVIVQKLVDASVSGGIYEYGGKTFIEACEGMGHPVAYGLITPDIFIIDSYTGNIEQTKIGKKFWLYKANTDGSIDKRVVSEQRISMDEGYAKRVFEVYRRVADKYGNIALEWSIERGRIQILQVKPVIESGSDAHDEESEGDRTKGFPLSRGFGKGFAKIVKTTGDLSKINKGDVIIAKVLSPEFIPFLTRVNGFVSEHGGWMSSVSFVCREMGIPSVAGIDIERMEETMITVDGENGYISVIKDVSPEETPVEYKELESIPATDLTIYLSLPEASSFEGNAEIILRGTSSEEELLSKYQIVENICRRIYPKNLWFMLRSDITGRRILNEPEILNKEIETSRFMQERGIRNFGFIVPFVSSVEELRVTKENTPFSFKLGIEISNPSGALEIESMCKEGINFVLIDIEKLTKRTFSIEQPYQQNYYRNLSPVLRLVEDVANACRRYGIRVCAYLRNPYDEIIETLLRLGVRNIAVEQRFREETKLSILRAEKRILLDEKLSHSSSF